MSKKKTLLSPTVHDEPWITCSRGVLTCHIGNESLEQLHKDAERLGLKRSWFQEKSYPHYDLIGQTMIRRAEARGIKQVGRKEFLRVVKVAKSGEASVGTNSVRSGQAR